jgi:prepilin-type N-terminal cleavage/methylation domain-containing protein
MNKLNTKKGFTIIEVVLVLAIAGLIFLMVFIALPALQRNQRDTQRKNDLSRIQSAVNSYQANNKGKIPGSGELNTLRDST